MKLYAKQTYQEDKLPIARGLQTKSRWHAHPSSERMVQASSGSWLRTASQHCTNDVWFNTFKIKASDAIRKD